MSEFVEIAQIEDPDGVGLVASITQRDRSNDHRAFSFTIKKAFTDKTGVERHTNYLNERHIGAAIKLLILVEKRIQLEQDRVTAELRKHA